MTKRFDLCFDVEFEKGQIKKVVVSSNECPNCMSNRDLSLFAQCLTEINNLVIDEAKERNLYVKKKYEKRTR